MSAPPTADGLASRRRIEGFVEAGAGTARQLRVLLRAKASVLRPNRAGRLGRALVVIVFGLVVMLGAYRSAAWGGILLLAIDPTDAALGVLVTRRMIEIGAVLLSAALGISNLVTALNTFFLARDLELLHAAPVRPLAFYLARLTEVVVQSSWVMVPFVIPSFFGIGRALHAAPEYYLAAPFVVVALVVPVSVLAVGGATAVTRVVPAERAREVFLVLTGAALVGLYIAVRAARPEQFIDPARFRTLPALLESLGVSTPWAPTSWAADALLGLSGKAPTISPWSPLLRLGLLLFGSVGLGAALHLAAYEGSHAKAREVRGRPARRLEGVVRAAAAVARLGSRDPVTRAIMEKEVRVLLRDPQQWSQIAMLGALIVLFVFNFRFFAGLGLPESVKILYHLVVSGFVIGALGMRFVYPLVSMEGAAFWLLRSAPLSTHRLMAAKARGAFIVLETLALSLSGMGAWALDLSALGTITSLVLITPIAWLVAVLGVGLGAGYPRFTYENPAMIPMSFGGMLYAYWSLFTVIGYALLAGWPMYVLQRPGAARTPLALVLTVVLGLVALAVPFLSAWIGFRMGGSRLDEVEDRA